MRSKLFMMILMATMAVAAGCGPEVRITHDPVVATSTETVTFTAEVLDGGPCKVEILVNATLVQTCNNVATGGTCTYTGGPYPAYEGTTVSFLATATDSDGDSDTRGYYYFGITDASYNWGTLPYAPARVKSFSSSYDHVFFHMASDYASRGAFVDDVEDKINDVLAEQAIVGTPYNMDKLNFWIYRKTAASASGCGQPNTDASTDIPWGNVHAVLHVANFGDCCNLSGRRYSAEGGNTKAFLHESGHGVFGLADEYCGNTSYFQPANEPNIFDTQAACQSEQTAKGRDPADCYRFCANQGGWWGIHDSDGSAPHNVMVRGMVNDLWGTESEERVRWYFDQF